MDDSKASSVGAFVAAFALQQMQFLLMLGLLLSTTLANADEHIPQVRIPAGPFTFGCSAEDTRCDPDEGIPGGTTIDVPEFAIDTQETSVAEYRQCVDAGACERPYDYRRTHYCNFNAPGRDDYPINCVNWQLAYDYCVWRGGRLAYEIEWEKAARGGTTTPHFWGNERADCSRAVMDPGKRGDLNRETDGCWRDLSWPRNSFPPNPFGLYDVIGGTSEWVMDWYDADSHTTHYAQGKLTGPAEGTKKVIKGGSWDEKFWAQRVSNRFSKPITGNPDLYGSNGIRCVIPIDIS